jgi:hypothetical protein
MASAYFPTIQPVTSMPSTRMSLLSRLAWNELKRPWIERREFDRQVR